MSRFDPGYFHTKALRDEGFARVGKHVSVAANCTIIGVENITIGDNVRIDGFCTLIAAEGGITIESNIHIASYCLLSGGDGIEMQDFSGLSQGVKIYSRTDDYSGKYLTNPTVPATYTGVVGGKVTLGRHVIVGAGSVVLPGVTIREGSSVGALSLVGQGLDEWGVYAGVPVRRVRDRSREILDLEADFLGSKADE